MLLLCGTTEIHQFLKIPLLITHYQHHKNNLPGMTLVDFLQLHYNSQEHPNDNDDQEDEELPFRSAGTIAHIDPFQPLLKELQLPSPRLTQHQQLLRNGSRCYNPRG